MKNFLFILLFLSHFSCQQKSISYPSSADGDLIPAADFTITADQTHDKFSSAIPYQIKVPNGSVVEAFTKEATGGQLNIHSTEADFQKIDWTKIHTLTGPIQSKEHFRVMSWPSNC